MERFVTALLILAAAALATALTAVLRPTAAHARAEIGRAHV